jgi:phenylpyruvate tautomerase PptA (4-oxalocrotonate tautomerase family)
VQEGGSALTVDAPLSFKLNQAGRRHILIALAEVEGDKVRLSANADITVMFQEADDHSWMGRGTQTSASTKPADGTVVSLNLGPVL